MRIYLLHDEHGFIYRISVRQAVCRGRYNRLHLYLTRAGLRRVRGLMNRGRRLQLADPPHDGELTFH